jgi:hypothetical protein
MNPLPFFQIIARRGLWSNHGVATRTVRGSTKSASADARKCFDTAMKEVKLPKYEKWTNYETGLPANVERFCYCWGRGY